MEINILVREKFESVVDTTFLEKIAGEAVNFIRPEGNYEFGVVITGDDEMRQLNRVYRGIDKSTDVLSFAMGDEPEDDGTLQFPLSADGVEHLGEVIISYERALEQAQENNHPVDKEISVLLIHGVLHLLGYDHEDDSEAGEMEQAEADMLQRIEELK
ncbi:MAG: rRNA maturation RNase YbeY [Dehalococcoidaceae bacterium]|nr:rRNA maturation RNase YbeY [Dehalococcoidaceae bacterium]